MNRGGNKLQNDNGKLIPFFTPFLTFRFVSLEHPTQGNEKLSRKSLCHIALGFIVSLPPGWPSMQTPETKVP
jgi:hypothetical protein